MEPGRWHCRQRMPVVRVSPVFAALSWTSWAAGHCCLSGCIRCPRFPVGHPGRLPQANTPCRPYNMRSWHAGKITSSVARTSCSWALGSDSQSAIAAGCVHTCAVRAEDQLVCFGRNDSGQCNVPTDLGPVMAIAAGLASHVCSQIQWPVGLLWSEAQKTMQCAKRFGTGCSDGSRRLSHVCSQSRWSVGLLWKQRTRTMQCANGFGTGYGDCSRPGFTRVQSDPMASWWSEGQRTMQCANRFGTGCSDGSRRLSHVCSQSRWSVGLLWKQRTRTMQCANGFGTGYGDCSRPGFTRVQSDPMASWSALERRTKDNAMCQQIWDQLWRLLQAGFTRVQSEPMVSWSALERTAADNAMCQRIWDWRGDCSRPGFTRVQSEPMASWSALERRTKDDAMCHIWDGPVVAIAAGFAFMGAVRADGQSVCFGSNKHGKCDVPMDLGPVVAVAAGGMTPMQGMVTCVQFLPMYLLLDSYRRRGKRKIP